MADATGAIERLEGAGLSVHLDDAMQTAALRYFAGDGAFTAAVRELAALALPKVLQAACTADGRLLLAWRSPTETLCLTDSSARLSDLEAKLAGAADGCFVNLSGGLQVLRVTGERIPDLLSRLGGTASIPRPGEARRSRMADVPVLALSLRARETLLLVDRGYAEHLLRWIRETLLDFADP